jgi:3-ketosteroid 9alpha-monooxygenase subunit A
MAKAADYDLGEFTFPRGWFMVADAEKVTRTPLSVRFFGKDLVLYRGESGKVYMVGAYCPHMRTHIGRNTTSYVVQQGRHVEGESIRCPYHGWKFGPDGRCNEIPYFPTVPEKAALDSYPVVERYNAIFYWHDPEGGDPDYELPTLPEWDDPTWVRWNFDNLGAMDCHQIEVVDNICDVGHLLPIHATTPQYFETEFRGHKAWQRLGGRHETLGVGAGISEFNTYYTGPGILISRFLGDNDSLMFITHTPIDDGSVYVWHATLTKVADRTPTEEDIKAAREYQEISRAAFAQDFEIWSNKQACFQPMQLPTDGNFAKVRNWYKQFYNPRARTAEFLQKVEGVYGIPGMPRGPSDEERRKPLLAAD